MSAQIKPIKVWGQGGPNPPKVIFILEELDLPHEIIFVALSDVKKPEYVAINPNGRLPAIHDPNTNITLWESGAIMEYLIEHYDTQHRLSFARGTPEYYHAKQWLFFQTTGQGPYYGQAAWFIKYHPENCQVSLNGIIRRSIGSQVFWTGTWLDRKWNIRGAMTMTDPGLWVTSCPMRTLRSFRIRDALVCF